MNRILNFWTNLRASLWFIPGLMTLFSIGLALGLIELDTRIESDWLAQYPRLFGLGADGSRGMLTAIASSMLTVATLAFSLTLNAVTQASGQFTPRIFRNFLRDRANQFVLGYFVSVFAYCLIILRTIRGGDELKFVPSFGVIVGLLLALGGIAVLIFFIHHIAASLQITTIIDNIVDETKEAIDTIFPEKMGVPADAEEKAEARRAKENQIWKTIAALEAGYVQTIDVEDLLEFAEENQVILKMERGIGQFVRRGENLISIAADTETEHFETIFDDEKIEEVNSFFAVNRHRTIEQDVGFGIRQIVDIALKALSSGVNDTTTAITCIDYLGEIVGEIARRQFPPQTRSKNNLPRVIVLAPEFADYVETAFDQIRISGKGNLAVFERLTEAAAFVASCADEKSRRASLKLQIELVGEFAAQTLETDYEKQKIATRVSTAMKIFD